MSKSIDVINFRRRIKIALVKAFGERYQYCGEKFPEVVFDFHHLNPKEKNFSLGNGSTTRAKSAYAEEAKKCCMLCANCHRRVESGEFNNSILKCNFNENIYYSTLEQLTCKKERVTYEKRIKAHSRKPDRSVLKSLIREMPFTQIGKMFEVSDNAIRKWCKSYNLPSKVSLIKTIPDEEWNFI